MSMKPKKERKERTLKERIEFQELQITEIKLKIASYEFHLLTLVKGLKRLKAEEMIEENPDQFEEMLKGVQEKKD